MKKLDMIRGGFEFLVSAGVSLLVGSALTMVKPTNLGAIKKIVAGVGAFAISMFAVDKVTDHVDTIWVETEAQIKEIFPKRTEEETVEEEA